MSRTPPDIRISSVVTASMCPLRFFLDKGQARTESWRYSVAKQISYRLGDLLDTDEIWEDIRLLQKDIDGSVFPVLTESVRLCNNNPGWRIYREADVAVRSGSHRIHGIVDKVFDDEPFFAVTRPTPAPSRGVSRGTVEYIHSGIERVCTIEPIDKRKFLRALYEARRITNGELPRKPLRPPCTSCPHSDRCDPAGGKRLSDLL
ncbi:MAG: hypothetical protein GKC06_04505 [Methanomicrobiales archaeon]|nr:hypothetical protein [Methanomicrobiales archaeon]